MAEEQPWWRTLFELRLSEGCWEEPEFLTEQDVAFLAGLLADRKSERILDLAYGDRRLQEDEVVSCQMIWSQKPCRP